LDAARHFGMVHFLYIHPSEAAYTVSIAGGR
jgi:hypothetical protein